MDEVNKLILELATFQAAPLINANAMDDDMEKTWLQLKDDWEALRTNADRYLEIKDSGLKDG